MNKKILGTIAMTLLFAEVLLVIVSWLLSATMMEGARSLLSSEGIRWLFGSFTNMMASPLLVWLILMLSALGCLQKSRVMSLFGRQPAFSYREKTALRVAVLFFVIYLVIIALLTLTPHAILLSATGELFPSAFSRSLVPIVAFGISLFSLAYGMMAGVLKSHASILDALSSGISKGASLIIILMLIILFRESLRFVFV